MIYVVDNIGTYLLKAVSRFVGFWAF
jgi:hypothetical protein